MDLDHCNAAMAAGAKSITTNANPMNRSDIDLRFLNEAHNVKSLQFAHKSNESGATAEP